MLYGCREGRQKKKIYIYAVIQNEIKNIIRGQANASVILSKINT
jgi:hypothetical protein